jgi:diaminohydroxyphosphoribosylaminopyrimidine deaminase / 5-amino-6-(5-phosphoribosylamino)uracil reductase
MNHNQDLHWMHEAVRLSQLCPPATGAFSVGAVLVGADGNELTRGHSRETDSHIHAEEAALGKLTNHLDLAAATLYSTLEPCSQRRSRPRTCTQLILDAGIGRVVMAWREPALFVDCQGYEQLVEAGVDVVELPELAALARQANSHLLPRAE